MDEVFPEPKKHDIGGEEVVLEEKSDRNRPWHKELHQCAAEHAHKMPKQRKNRMARLMKDKVCAVNQPEGVRVDQASNPIEGEQYYERCFCVQLIVL